MLRKITIAIAACLIVTAAQASSCMTRTEARDTFETSYIYWHGANHCWNATSPRSRHVLKRDGERSRHNLERDAVPFPEADQRRLLQVMAIEPEPVLPPQETWLDRWTEITTVAPRPMVATIVEREPEPMVTPRDVVAMILTVFLSIALFEVVSGGQRRRRGFGTR